MGKTIGATPRLADISITDATGDKSVTGVTLISFLCLRELKIGPGASCGWEKRWAQPQGSQSSPLTTSPTTSTVLEIRLRRHLEGFPLPKRAENCFFKANQVVKVIPM